MNDTERTYAHFSFFMELKVNSSAFFLVREQLLPGELEFSDQDNFGLDGPAQVR